MGFGPHAREMFILAGCCKGVHTLKLFYFKIRAVTFSFRQKCVTGGLPSLLARITFSFSKIEHSGRFPEENKCVTIEKTLLRTFSGGKQVVSGCFTLCYKANALKCDRPPYNCTHPDVSGRFTGENAYKCKAYTRKSLYFGCFGLEQRGNTLITTKLQSFWENGI